MRKFLLMSFILLSSVLVFAQEANHEVNSEVKELSNFHAVIYKLWHTAWPKKDVNMMQTLTPEIEKGVQNVADAKLPGILRDKAAKWNEGVAELKKSADDYKSAVEKKDSVSLLKHAETLHANYEKLVRVIRPVMPEVDQFHQELYLVYHYYMPEKNVEKIKSSSKILLEKIAAVKNGKLPKRLETKKESFDSSVAALETEVKKLNEIVEKENQSKVINDAVNSVHTKYQSLEKVFD